MSIEYLYTLFCSQIPYTDCLITTSFKSLIKKKIKSFFNFNKAINILIIEEIIIVY